MSSSVTRQIEGLTLVHSTPGGPQVALKSQAGDAKYLKKQLEAELKADLTKADRCSFDHFLKFCQYLVLKPDSQEKKDLFHLQNEIETLQFQRFYPEPSPTAHGTTPGKAGKKELFSVKSRDDKLDTLLHRLLQVTLLIANLEKYKRLLKDLDQGFSNGEETNRYPPFVNLCNELLQEMKGLDETKKPPALNEEAQKKGVALDLPFRKADELDIRFQVNDPARITFRYHGTTLTIERCPDVIISSYAALARLSRSATPQFYKRPDISPEWVIVLSSVEFKVRFRKSAKRRHFRGELISIMNHTFELKLVEEHAQDEITKLDSQADDEEEAEFNREEQDKEDKEDEDKDEKKQDDAEDDNPFLVRRSKRTRVAARLGTGEGQPATKKTKVLPTPSTSGTKSVTSQPTQEVKEPDQTDGAVDGRFQCASYGLEMLSHSIGVHHAINILFTDGILWVWYYDRQGIIQSTGISLFKDFPRFIALLFMLQRFSLADWGVIPDLNPEALRQHLADDREGDQAVDPTSVKIALQGADGPLLNHYKDFTSFWHERGDESLSSFSSVTIKAKEFLSYQPHCLGGRATAVMPAVGSDDSGGETNIVCKVYHPEVQRRHEGVTMDVIYAIAKADENDKNTKLKKAELGDWDMFDHLPTFYFYGSIDGTSTHQVRSMLNCDWKGHREARIIGMKGLQRVTIRKEWDFVKAWLEGVICHAFLWKHRVEHGDPSLGNLMFNEGRGRGVVTDFDLSLLQWEPRVPGTDRTGTIPFMALDLLSEDYWRTGTFIRRYHHELESFIWMLPYMFLLYQDGKRLPSSLVDPWRTSDYHTCHKEKTSFLDQVAEVGPRARDDFQGCWPLAESLCIELSDLRNAASRRKVAFSRANKNAGDAETSKWSSIVNQDAEAAKASPALWKVFVDSLRSLPESTNVPEDLRLTQLIGRLEYYKPTFNPLTPEEKENLQQLYHHILSREQRGGHAMM